MGVRGRIQ
uniref:Uncharacterized protein n=1 Tax=Vitis vinifera TaxID=29760 RepID=F6H2I5_VITVI